MVNLMVVTSSGLLTQHVLQVGCPFWHAPDSVKIDRAKPRQL